MRKAVIAGMACAVACAMFGLTGWSGVDITAVWRPTATAYLQGETRLFDGGAPGFFFAPWAIFPLLVTAWISLPWMWGILAVASLAGVLVACYAVTTEQTPKVAPLLVMFSAPMWSAVLNGNVDGIVAGAVGLGWLAIKRRRPWLLGFALLVLSCKPVNVALVALLFLRLAWTWSSKERLAVVAPTGAALALSFPLFGLDWPVRYIQAMRNVPPLVSPQVSLWRVFTQIGCPAWYAYSLYGIAVVLAIIIILRRKRPETGTLALVLALSLAFSPYLLSTHLVLLAPALVWLITQRRRWRWLWLTMIAPFLRWCLGDGVAWLALVYPMALLLAVCLQRRASGRARRASEAMLAYYSTVEQTS